jgi:hypothetical protein
MKTSNPFSDIVKALLGTLMVFAILETLLRIRLSVHALQLSSISELKYCLAPPGLAQ